MDLSCLSCSSLESKVRSLHRSQGGSVAGGRTGGVDLQHEVAAVVVVIGCGQGRVECPGVDNADVGDYGTGLSRYC